MVSAIHRLEKNQNENRLIFGKINRWAINRAKSNKKMRKKNTKWGLENKTYKKLVQNSSVRWTKYGQNIGKKKKPNTWTNNQRNKRQQEGEYASNNHKKYEAIQMFTFYLFSTVHSATDDVFIWTLWLEFMASTEEGVSKQLANDREKANDDRCFHVLSSQNRSHCQPALQNVYPNL